MNRRRTIAAVLVAFCILLISLHFRDEDGPLSTMQDTTTSAFAPTQKVAHGLFSPVVNAFSSLTDIGRLRSRIDALEEDNRQLRQQSFDTADLLVQNDELRALLQMAKREQLNLVGAKVIAHPPTDVDRQVLIDRGFSSGIGIGMAVMDEYGVIGVIDRVAANYSTVDLISSEKANLVVRVAQSGARGTLVGQGADLLALTITDPNVVVPQGADIVTQLFTGSAIPDGLPVGRLENNETSTATTVDELRFVRPFGDVTKATYVSVVLSSNAPTTSLEGEPILNVHAQPIPPFENQGDGNGTSGEEQEAIPTVNEVREELRATIEPAVVDEPGE